MMNYDLIIIGSGPGGYVAAIRASQLGLKTAVVERAELGGICLNWGCIPTKALLKSAQVFSYLKHAEEYGIFTEAAARPDLNRIVGRSREVSERMSKGVQFLLKKNKVDHMEGYGRLVDCNAVAVTGKDGNETRYEAPHIIIATGARSKELPNLKQDGRRIIGYREAMTLKELPQSMVVVGSGAIGSEFAHFYNTLGTRVTLVEYLPGIVPLEDEEVSKQLERSFKKAGMEVLTASSVESVEISGNACRAVIATPKGVETREAEVVLSAVGIAPNIEDIGLEKAGIALEKGKIKVDAFYRTNVEGIYAIGDVIPGPALAHVASAEGIVCVEQIAGKNPEAIDYTNIPGCTYTAPEIASVGLTEKAAREAGYEIRIGKFPFMASGKASASGNRDGFIKLIFDTRNDQLLGAHMIGDQVTEMIAGMVTVRKQKIRGPELINTMHPHPTLSEAIMEAAAAAYGEAIHL
jgi:dihydrolipoamide dehydrogenase